MIDAHAIDTLEFPKVIALIGGQCLTPYGRAEVADIRPIFDRSEIDRLQSEYSQMKDIVRFGLPFPLYRTEDCRELLAKSRISGMFLAPDEILQVADLVALSTALHGYDKESREKFPLVAEYLQNLRAFPELHKEIHKAIDEHANIKDDASPELRRVRIELNDTRRRVINRLEQLLGAQKKQPGWTDDIVTQRNGRYVIPVPASSFRNEIGILHDRSQSGATLFVEPKETVELNNRVNLLSQEERIEMDRILRHLTSEIAARADALEGNIALIASLDRMYATAQFAIRTESHRPNIVDSAGFKLEVARHPLLVWQSGSPAKVVPLTLELNHARQAVLVTGPNTGGKTVALKTIGLLVLMAQSGLPIPASERSTVGTFRQLYADIGDEQSIELSLSTFSSHIGNIIRAITRLSPDTLVLLDEIGAGTDPKEGAALAEAIILHIVRSGARLVATTHYSQLKSLALDHAAIENASLEFDRETLAPTYRLHVGLPGSSYAVEIAGRLGMPAEVCEHASILVGTGERSLNELIASLEKELKQITADRAELTDRLTKARDLEEQYRIKTEKFRDEIDEERTKALEETQRLLDETRKETERLVGEIRKTQASKESIKKLQQTLKVTQKGVGDLKQRLTAAHKEAIETIRFQKGDQVRIATLNQQGLILEMVGEDRARVQVGNVNTIVELRHLRQPDADGSARSVVRPAGRIPHNNDISPEIHLRGMTGEEAVEALEKFIDRAVVAGLGQIYVIHGKGTGALRRIITDYLKKHAEVDSFTLGNWNEGGAGVTVVKLKQ
ncbi:MAG: endonuclease MutS2 [Candidatus Zixiibacteriota bacterium]